MLLNKKNEFHQFGYMVDCSRGAVPKISTLKKLVDILKAFDYTYLMLYTEDLYEIDGEPYFGYKRGRYSADEIKELDKYCIDKGIELRPCIQTLAHLGRLKRHACYSDLFEINDILTVKDDRVYTLIDKMFNAISKMFSSRNIHIGMDEAWALGRGKFLDNNGILPKEKIMQYHLERVSKIAKKYGFECEIWADMIMQSYQESKDKENFSLKLPNNIFPIDWRYWIKNEESSLEEFKLYSKLTNGNFGFAAGAQKWNGFVPNNQYSFYSLDEQIKSCKIVGVKRFVLTAWADGAADASVFSTIPTLFYATLLAHNLNLNDETKLYFKNIIGIDFNQFMNIDLLNRLTIDKESHSFNNLYFINLYNDLFQGIYDDAIIENSSKVYLDAANTLKELSNNKFELNYIFKSLVDLANCLIYKADLSKSIYDHYKEKDIEGLELDIEKIGYSVFWLRKFIDSYEVQWHKENKSFGFEKQCIRLGGLIERLNYCSKKLSQYINKKIDSIEELEEERLPISTKYWNHEKLEDNCFNNYQEIVSGGFLKEI